MKITSKGGIHNAENSAGFVNIEEVEGTTMRINAEYLKTALKVIDTIEGMGLNTENISIGIVSLTEEKERFCIFLDPNKTVAYAIAGKTEE